MNLFRKPWPRFEPAQSPGELCDQLSTIDAVYRQRQRAIRIKGRIAFVALGVVYVLAVAAVVWPVLRCWLAKHP
jgi:hypothetical protein